MDNYLNEWRDFLLDVLGEITRDIDEESESDSLLARFNYLYEEYNLWGLSKLEFLALIFAVCKEFYPQIDRLIKLANSTEDNSKKSFSYGLVALTAGLFFHEDIDIGSLLDENSFLNEIFICPEKITEDIRLGTGIKLRSGVSNYFLGKVIPLGTASLCARCIAEEDLDLVFGEVIAHKNAYEQILTIGSMHEVVAMEGIIFLKAEKGAGKKFLAGKLADELESNLMILDVTKFFNLDEIEREKVLTRIIQLLVLYKYLIYIDCNDEEMKNGLHESEFIRLLTYISKYTNLIVMGGTDSISTRLTSVDIYEILLERISDEEQQKFYENFAKDMEVKFAKDVKLSEITSKYRLNAGKIRKVIKNCLMDIDSVQTKDKIEIVINKKVLESQIRKICLAKFDGLATRLCSSFTFDDLTVSSEARQKFDGIINRVIYRGTVLEKYGFDKKLPYGRGLVIALYGPPGTGKTMAANVLANELGLDIYRIDLSQISSKYIGESEKNLGAVFDAAKDSNAILFFDEADALFAKRTDVTSSNDKHSNSETAFLLQKMEEYEGISILATNVMQNFDSAFKRRITYMINIEKPGAEERLRLWENVFPEDAPLAEDVRLEVLAQKADIPGSSIKSAAVAAAYRAAARGNAITHEDLAICTDEEYKKTGHTSILRDLLYGYGLPT
ncbi:MAG: AAA family ATPase [Butyrivibrio sp.]|nr:AAA family ATPase [Butyrivibrio sp.]